MRILGIDPGYDRLGVAIVDGNTGKPELTFSDCLTSDKKNTFPKRLAKLGTELEKIIKKYRPEQVALETLFFAKNRKTAMLVSETRGMILYLAGKNNLPVIEIAPGSVKLTTTGYGQADKKQVSAMLPRLIKLEKAIKHDDEYDAIAVALTALSTVKLK